MEKFNILLFQWIHNGAGHRPMLDMLAVFCASFGPYVLGGMLVLLWFLSDVAHKTALIETTEAALLALIINQAIGLVYYHPRPFMEGLCAPLIPHVPETSFPSDHVSLLTAATGYLLLVGRRRISGGLLAVVTCLTAWSRVYAGLHFPLDVIGGLAAGIVSIWLVTRFKKQIYPLNQYMLQFYRRLAAILFVSSHFSGPAR